MEVFFAIVALIVLTVIIIYNGLVRKRNQVDNCFPQIDVQLMKRYDLVPGLVETVKGYTKHERETLEQVTRIRTEALRPDLSNDKKVEKSNKFGEALGGLFARIEAYPDLKASESYLFFMRTLNEFEEQISAARRFFNTATQQYNDAVQTFPSNMVSNAFLFRTKPYFEINEIERNATKVAMGTSDGERQ
jgi:LemA protein